MELGFIYAIGAAIIWGLTYVVTQKILVEVTPLILLFFNSIIASAILLPIVLINGGSFKNVIVAGKANLGLIIFCTILTMLANFLILSSIKRLDASTASIIEISYPFFVVLFSYFAFHSVPNIYFFIGGALVFAGSFIIIRFAN